MEQNWLTIEETEHGKVLTKCSPEATGEIIIPEGVTEIGSYAFVDGFFEAIKGITSIIIPNTVTIIGESAFAHCEGLSSIIIPDSVIEIADRAFSGTGISSVTIPGSVVSISNTAFNDCKNLTSIRVDEQNIVFDSRENCNAIINTQTNELICGCQTTCIPNTVTSIGKFAFCGSGLTTLLLPHSVTSIGYYAFNSSNLIEISIPDSVTRIESAVFGGCTKLKSIEIPASVTEIGDNAFGGCTGLSSIVIPDSVIEIAYGAFRKCTDLTSIVLPSSVTEIGSYAFDQCSNLTSIVMSPKANIEHTAFDDCHLKNITLIPPCYVDIAYPKFYGGTFEMVTIPPELVEDIEGPGYEYCPSIVRIDIPRNNLHYNDELIKLLRWNISRQPWGKLILTVPEPCKEDSSISGYIRVTKIGNQGCSISNIDKIVDM